MRENPIMFEYDEAKKYLREHLLRDAQLHISEDYWGIGDNFDEFDTTLPRNDDPKLRKLHIALNFWDGWQDARNHDWLFYEGISQGDWPERATALIQDIEEERESSAGKPVAVNIRLSPPFTPMNSPREFWRKRLLRSWMCVKMPKSGVAGFPDRFISTWGNCRSDSTKFRKTFPS